MSSFFCGEHPLDALVAVISSALPGSYLGDEEVLAVDATIQALPLEDTDFDLHHVQPAGVFGRVVELDAAKDAPSLGGRKARIEPAREIWTGR